MKRRILTLILTGALLPAFTGCESKNDEKKDPVPLFLTLSLAGFFKTAMDVHGAGAQRSDPKTADPIFYAGGHGPQGDVVRVYNYARCVRGSTGSQSDGKSYAIVDTHQTTCYDNGTKGVIDCPSAGEDYYGQDANYAGLSPSYTTTTHSSGDVVTDNRTGLMWTRSYEQVEWASRDTAAAARTDGGYTDWRAPTIKELYSLMEFDGRTGMADPSSSSTPSDADPYLDQSVFSFEYPSGTNVRYIDAQYITSTKYVSKVFGSQECFFGVNFADGRIKCYPLTGNASNSKFYIRYVRDASGSGYGNNSFADNGNGTITDSATGLTWMQKDSGDSSVASSVTGTTRGDGSLNFKEALAFCENLTYAGSSDWRLPDAKELQSLMDYSRSPDTTSSPALNALFQATSITDEAGEVDYPYYWSSTTHLDGLTDGEWGVYLSAGRALGFMNPM